jgi:RHS repeat-associated protein
LGTAQGTLLPGEIITPVYQWIENGVKYRWVGVQAGVDGNETRDYLAVYSYDDAGRLEYVTGPGLPATGDNPGAKYLYLADSDLVEKTRFQTSDDGILATAIRSYEPDRDLLAGVQNYWGSGTSHLISQYAYVNNDLGLRSSVVRTGDAFEPDHHDDWVYNDRQELLSAYRWETTDPGTDEDEVTSARRLYTYDAIGNRLTYTPDEQTPATTYTVNNLNAYTATTNPANTFTYDADGNLTARGWSGQTEWTLTWDGENRLVAVTPGGLMPVGTHKVTFAYDYRNRRVRKQEYDWDLEQEEWVEAPAEERRYLWDGWRMVLELSNPQQTGFQVVRKYTWGLDLAGLNGQVNSLEGAGTIGGLLAVAQTSRPEVFTEPVIAAGNYIFFYDGNGNVGQLVDWADSVTSPASYDWDAARLVATYEYDPYGGKTASSGSYADANRMRFSTKYWDGETGLGYWGYRYYSPRLGRWISRDPIGEEGGVNLYAYVRNVPTYLVDAWGMKPKWAALTSYMSRDGRAWLVMRDGCCTQSMGVSIDGANVAVAYPEQYGEPADSKTYLKLVDVNALRQSGALKLWWTERYNIRTQEVTLPYTSQDKLWFSGDAALVYAAAENVGAGVTFSRLSVPYRVWPAANNGGTDPGLSMGTFGKFLEAAYISADLICAAGRSGELQLLNPSSAYGADVSLSEGTRRQLTPPYQIGPQRGSSKYRDPVDYIHATTYYLSISGKWFEPEVASGWSVSVKQDAYVYSDDSGGSHTPVWQKQLRHLAMPGQPLPEEPPRPPYDGVVLP